MFFAEQNENATMIDMLVPGPNIFLSLKLVFAHDIRIGRSHWNKMVLVNMEIVELSLRFTTIVHVQESFVFFLKKPFYLEISNAEGTKG